MTETPPGYVRRLREAVEYRLWHASGALYVAAGSLIGFEALAALLGYITIWPVGIPATLLAIGAYALVRSRLRRRNRAASDGGAA